MKNEEVEFLYKELKDKYKKMTITKKELASELSISISTIDFNIARGYDFPDYVKMGDARNSRVLFKLRDVAKYLARATVKMA